MDKQAFAAIFEHGERVQVSFRTDAAESSMVRGDIAASDDIGLALRECIWVYYTSRLPGFRLFLPWAAIRSVSPAPAKCHDAECELDEQVDRPGWCYEHWQELDRERETGTEQLAELPF